MTILQEDNDQDSAACSLEDDHAEEGFATDNDDDNDSDAQSDSGADSEHSDEFNTGGTPVNFSSSAQFQQQQLQQQQARHQSIDSYQVSAPA
jgi:hypothetical protein